METQIIPKFLESRKSKAGKVYFQVETSDGEKYTIHEQDIANQVSANFGKPILVEVAVSGDWKNIRKFVGAGDPSKVQAPKIEKQIERPSQDVAKNGYKFKDAAMLTAYAKDLTIACLNKSEKKSWTSDEVTSLMQDCGSMIMLLYNDILSAI